MHTSLLTANEGLPGNRTLMADVIAEWVAD